MTTNQQPNTTAGANLFASATQSANFGGANQLNKTAQLTAHSTAIANQIFMTMMASEETAKAYENKIKASQESHDAMDDLINELYDLSEEDLTYVAEIEDEDAEKMIRSQQSKRSRAKSKVMTQENYMTMMVGAVAENILRLACEKPKSSGGGAVMGDVGYTEAQLEKFASDQDALKKAIRNVQSKKSIMKSKADFDAESPRWKQLLLTEQQLKAIRDQGIAQVNEEAKKALEVKEKAAELLSNIDNEELSPDQAKDLLAQVREMLANKE